MQKYTIAVVGMGYVGITSALVFASNDAVDFVYGIQRRSRRSGKKIDMLNSGINPMPEERSVTELLEYALDQNKFQCTDNVDAIGRSNVVLIDVQTPFVDTTPDFSHLRSAINDVSKYLQADTLVSIESTITPGSTDGWISQSIENLTGMTSGVHYHLAHAPERVTPGKLVENMVDLDRCVGGVDTRGTEVASDLYSHIMRGGKIIPMTAREAEFTKTAENAMRDLQIATANQLALYAESMGINYYKVAEGIQSLKGIGVSRGLLNPGAGVGGHCLVKDTYHLELGKLEFSRGFDDMPPEFSSLFMNARDINNFMPQHMFNLTVHGLVELKTMYGLGKTVNIGVLGWAFAENTGDFRNTPSRVYYDMFNRANVILCGLNMHYDIRVHDPYVSTDDSVSISNDLHTTLNNVDVVVGFTKHSDYSSLTPTEIKGISGKDHMLFVDGRNMFNVNDVISQGCIYRGIGRGDVN
jgi:UDP-N-acetyl-D-mannosaminuronic acid dehydrogenase